MTTARFWTRHYDEGVPPEILHPGASPDWWLALLTGWIHWQAFLQPA